MVPIGSTVVLWDAYGVPEAHSGIGRYSFNVCRALEGLNCQLNPLVGLQKGKAALYSELLRKSRVAWNLRLGSLLSAYRKRFPETKLIYHGFSNTNMPSRIESAGDFASLITVHDIIPILYPRSVSWKLFLEMKLILRKSLDLVDGVVCVSDWTRNQLIDLYNIPQERVFVIPNGFPQYRPRVFMADDGFVNITTISRFESYKNFHFIGTLLKKNRVFRWRVVTDQRGSKFLQSCCATEIMQGRLSISVGVSDAELDKIYQNTHVYASLSSAEGFCLPVSEAISRNIPVVFMKGSGVEETAGNIVSVGLPGDSSFGDWSDAVLMAYDRNRQTDFVDKGRKYHEKKLSWGDVGEKLKRLYDTI